MHHQFMSFGSAAFHCKSAKTVYNPGQFHSGGNRKVGTVGTLSDVPHSFFGMSVLFIRC